MAKKKKAMAKSRSLPSRGQRTDPPKAPSLSALGMSGLDHGWGRINEEWLNKLRGSQAMEVFREMYDNNGLIGGIFRLSEEMIAATEWTVEAAGDDPSTDQLGKHLLETSLTDMDQTWPDFISEVMTMGIFGHAVMEHWWKKRLGDSDLREFNSKYADGYYGIRHVALRAQESLERWNIADNGDILGMYQRPAPSYRPLYIDMHRALLFRTRAVKNNPEGRSWLRPGYRSWWFIKRFQEMEGIGVERDVAGYPDMQAPLDYFMANATDAQKAFLETMKQQVERIRQDTYAGILRPSSLDSQGQPTGFDFQLIQGGSRNATVFDLIIKRYESRLAISLLGEFMLLGQDKVGSFALSSEKTHMFSIALGGVLQRIADVINRDLGPRLMRFNGLPGVCAPTFKFADLEQEAVLQFAQAVNSLVTSGVLTPDNAVERYARDYLNLPPIGEISQAQLEDAIGGANEKIDQEPDNPMVDAENVDRALDTVEAAADEPTEPETPSEYITVREAAEMLGISASSVTGALKREQLPFGGKVGSRWLIPRSSLIAYLNRGNS